MPRINRSSALNQSYQEFTLAIPSSIRTDLELACRKFVEFIPPFIQQRTRQVRRGFGWKCQLKILIEFEKYNWDRGENVYTEAWFLGNIFSLLVSDLNSLRESVRSSFSKISASFDTFVHHGSGWKLKSILDLEIKLFKFKLFSGGNSSRVEIPKDVAKRRACISVKGVPHNECFYYAVAAGLLCEKKNPQRAKNYESIVSVFKSTDINCPVDMKGVARFEKKVNISLNVFAYTDGVIHPLYVTDCKGKQFHVNLLLHRAHYFTVRNMSALICSQVRKSRTKMFICPYCLCYYVREDKFDQHTLLCTRNLQRMELSKYPEISFNSYTKMVDAPFVIYFDIESICEPVKADDSCTASVRGKGKHIPISVSAIRVCRPNPAYSSPKPFMYTGTDCIQQFFAYLQRQRWKIRRLANTYHAIVMTEEDEINFANSTSCKFCGAVFDGEIKKCRDHCHLSGRYRMALCDSCNLTRAKKGQERVFVFAHGLQNYDAHFLLSEAHKFQGDGCVFAMPRSEEKMITFSLGCFQFKDSFSFMSESLAELTRLLAAKGKTKFQNMRMHMPDEKTFEMLVRKGVFPYSYFDSERKLEETSLPPKEAFYNDLSRCHISDAEYSFAQFVWKEMECKTFKDYLETYLVTDVLLLADVFENFRTNCILDYELDPAHYLSSAQFTFDAFLRHSLCKLDSFQDVDHYLYVQSGIRGGVSQISHRSSVANNKYLTTYDPDAPSKFILYLDVVNLYGYAMTQPLPVGDLRWMSQEELKLDNLLSLPEFGANGCFVTVTLLYPEYLHDRHSDLPLAPAHTRVSFKNLSPYAQSVVSKHKLMTSTNSTKLMTDFLPKNTYMLHYRLLQFYVQAGLKVESVHSGLMFKQSPVMRSYIQLNSQKRAQSDNQFDSNFYKLLSNSLFGKTIERVDKKVTARIVSNASKLHKFAGKSTFKSGRRINDNLVSIILNQCKLTLNKPSYLGPAILDLAKLRLYHLHLNKIKKFYGSKAKLLFTDTDSLMYEIQTEDVYADLRIMDDGESFDFSNYPENHPNHSVAYKKVPGLLKDETAGIPVSKFIGLRSKMYCYTTEDSEGIEKVNKAAKGVPGSVIRQNLNFARFKQVLEEDEKQSDTFRCIRSEKHAVYTKEISKSTLCSFDDKRYLLDNINSLPYGHYLLKQKCQK